MSLTFKKGQRHGKSLGYATPTTASKIGLDGMNGEKNYCEWVYCCHAGNAREVLEKAIKNRHYHRGFMCWYKELAFPLVRHAIETGEEPLFAGWF